MKRREGSWARTRLVLLPLLGVWALACQPAPASSGGQSESGAGGRTNTPGGQNGGQSGNPGGDSENGRGGASGAPVSGSGGQTSSGSGGATNAGAGTGGASADASLPTGEGGSKGDDGGPRPDGAPAGTDASEPGPTPGARASVACGKAAAPAEGFHTLKVGARDRRVFLRLPTGYDGKRPWPVIFGFHGAGNKDGSWFDGKTNMTKANKGNAVIILGESLHRPGSTSERSWQDDGQLPDNLAYVDASLAWLGQNVCVDPGRVFAVGQSSGAFFSHTVACQRGDLFRAAAASDGGVRSLVNCKNNPGVLVRFRPTGGDGGAAGREVRDFWLKRNGCGTGAPQSANGTGCKAYAGCKPDGTVWECTDTGSHDWPAYMDRALWDFFSTFK